MNFCFFFASNSPGRGAARLGGDPCLWELRHVCIFVRSSSATHTHGPFEKRAVVLFITFPAAKLVHLSHSIVACIKKVSFLPSPYQTLCRFEYAPALLDDASHAPACAPGVLPARHDGGSRELPGERSRRRPHSLS